VALVKGLEGHYQKEVNVDAPTGDGYIGRRRA
jgi:hypothetical protein